MINKRYKFILGEIYDEKRNNWIKWEELEDILDKHYDKIN